MQPPANSTSPANLDDPALYINRDLSWLDFNRRVLEEAQDPTVPMLERLKFLAIFSSNLDEFFMVRVGGIQQKVQANIPIGSGADQLSPRVQLEQVRTTTRELVTEQYRVLHEEVLPALAGRGIVLRTADQLSEADRAHVRELFTREIFPVLTPLSTDPAHPFPHLQNKSLNLAVVLHRPNDADPLYAVVQVPSVLPRFLPLPVPRAETPGPTEEKVKAGTNGETSGVIPFASRPIPLAPTPHAFLPLEDAIRLHLRELFPGLEIGNAVAFRVTRDSEYEIDDEVDDLLEEIEAHVRARRRGHPVRLEIDNGAPPDMQLFLTDGLNLNAADVYPTRGPLDLTGLFQMLAVPGFADLRDPPFTPAAVSAFVQASNPWSVIRGRDVLVFHPYESFAPVVEFIQAAASDERVLAIKQTLYRTSSDSPIVRALQRAADLGKQVTAVVELKARMDEERNILWARELEKAGVHVVFGFVGLKTHCKVSLVVRRDEDHAIRRYVHLGSGNYNPQTARVYTDLGLFTCNPEVAEDATLLFNHLTASTPLPAMRKLLVAPTRLQTQMIEKIDREAANLKAGKPARLLVKVNGILEPAVVKALYRASQSGVKIDIACRGICSLRPGIPGVSENIRVISVVDRFLEHSRIFYFENGGSPEVFVGSADWMDRNLSRRVEVVFPIEQPDLKQRVIDVLKTTLADTAKARELLPDGHYHRVTPPDGQTPLRSQVRFLEQANEPPPPPPTAPATPKPVRRAKRR
ncbi:polyphosphate kinase : Polyphosphate kinase OS=Methylacidiphilum fumariolicum SolV GN=ppk PE=3 SV=1: PP_kinase_N: PP_kinase: PP_kinase_C [Gemmata massiliana]|uniref:Polyphosphate kinase n=1 Tax=Gemmata massiliana TaxID=1210884 RepID=A0A6P2CSD8_9BACT|nr:polyphosphate kinase 1 [Gemmata massiliana]VTR91841.1 polyphosphate kinase : Polyphosphate kinase OS=Methylacidiphilum fumariolicum SolV GN=ppk PE=3 SV=1: PP_kinase_N: PP_kinase: PP_kinase_C [Gemmata massiliana]